jgi:ADP-ribose pyrophosphatase
MTVELAPLEDCVRRVFAGQITNAAAVAGIMAAALCRSAGWNGLRAADARWAARPAAAPGPSEDVGGR